MDFNKIHSELTNSSSDNIKVYCNKLIPGAKPCLGIKIPILRKLAKEIAKDDYKYFLDNFPEEYWEHESLKAFVIGYAKDDINTILIYADKFIPKIHDWSVSDSFCQNFTIAKKHRQTVFDWLQKYIYADSEYSQRVVAVMLMSHFLVDDYYDKIFSVIDKLKHNGYYLKMGAAWCIATAYAKYPAAAMEYLKDNKLDDWTYNKSIQKMLESYRISEEDKIILRKMKR